MSNLKHKTLYQLIRAENQTLAYINKLEAKGLEATGRDKQTLSGQRERLKWIRKYIDQRENELNPLQILDHVQDIRKLTRHENYYMIDHTARHAVRNLYMSMLPRTWKTALLSHLLHRWG